MSGTAAVLPSSLLMSHTAAFPPSALAMGGMTAIPASTLVPVVTTAMAPRLDSPAVPRAPFARMTMFSTLLAHIEQWDRSLLSSHLLMAHNLRLGFK